MHKFDARMPTHRVAAVAQTILPLDEQLQICVDLMQQQLFGKAMALLELVNARFPQVTAILSDLGMCHAQLGNHEWALSYLRQATHLEPGFIPAWRHQFMIYFQLGQYENALTCCEKLLLDTCLNKNMYRQVLADMGLCSIHLKDYAHAAICLDRALELKADDALTLSHKALLLLKQEKLIESQVYLSFAAGSMGQNIEFMLTFITYYRNLGALTQIPPLLNQANQISPNNAHVLYQTGKWIEYYEGNITKAFPYFQKLYHHPNESFKQDAASFLAAYYNSLGCSEQALNFFYESYCLKPHLADLLSNYLFHLYASPTSTAADIFFWHQQFGKLHAEPLMPVASTFKNSRELIKRLRIGYVSADFKSHSSNAAFLSLLTQFNPEQFEIFAYANNKITDDIGAHIVGHIGEDHWREILGIDDETVAKRVRDDRIDILVDLSGHTKGNRLLMFARKPAPIQITGLGWGGTTGMKAMDYRISDCYVTPTGTEAFNVEKILYVSSLLHFGLTPRYEQTLVAEIPYFKKGYITFGFGNNPFKLNLPLLVSWAEILNRVPDSRLHMKFIAMDHPAFIARMTDIFGDHGIAKERLLFSGGTLPEQHLEFYQQVDIVLDSFPYNGGASTLDALWMSRPMVTLVGGTRAGMSILNVLGHPEWVANTSEEYVNIAVSLAQSPYDLAVICQQLRAKMQHSSLCNDREFVDEMEIHYRTVWQTWVHQQEQDG